MVTLFIRRPTFGGAMGVLDGCYRLNFPFFYALPPPLGPHNPLGRAGWSRFWAEGRALRADSSSVRPLALSPFADFPLRPCCGPLSMYPLAVSALSYVPFVSEPRRVPLSSYRLQFFKLSHVPSRPRRGTSVRNCHFLCGSEPLEASRLCLFTEK